MAAASRSAGDRRAALRRTLDRSLFALWAALLAGMLGEFLWLFELFAHFRVQYCVSFLALAAGFLLLGRRAAALAASAGAAISSLGLLAYVGAPAQASAAQDEAFRLVSFNVWFRNRDYERIAQFLSETNADAIVLQELSAPGALKLQSLLPGYPHAHVDRTPHSTVVFSRWPLEAESTPLADGGARGATVRIDWRGQRVTLLGAHLHWPLSPGSARMRNQELERLAGLAGAQGPLLVAGDLNITPWSPTFQRFVQRSGLNDCALGQGLKPSWPAALGWLGIRIDHCLASSHWRTLDLRVGPSLGSDHHALIVDLHLERSAQRLSQDSSH